MGIFDFLNANEIKQELENTKSAYDEKIQELEKQKIELEKRISELESQCDSSFQGMMDARFSYSSLHEEYCSLKKQFQSLENDAEQERIAQKNEILSLQEQLEHLHSSYDNILSENSELKNRIMFQDQWMQNKIKEITCLESNISNLRLQLETIKEQNLSYATEISSLNDIYAPFIPFQQNMSNIQKMIYDLQKYSLQMKFYHLLLCYCLERILMQKKTDCRYIYNSAVEQCKQKIIEYEENFRIEEYKQLRSYISDTEFYKLSPIERRQLALTRYEKSPKTEFEVGLKYERYIGYLYELENYEVRYHGALNKYRDKGIDLYAIKKKEVLVIQCKRWRKEATINEGTIRNLSGSVDFAKTKFPKREVQGILYTTTNVSKEAHKMADTLNIIIHENFDIQEYPMVKCNISETGEKIYHLPFDQQYDKTFITPKKGDFYVSTVEEAENFGFRRAHKWKPEK